MLIKKFFWSPYLFVHFHVEPVRHLVILRTKKEEKHFVKSRETALSVRFRGI